MHQTLFFILAFLFQPALYAWLVWTTRSLDAPASKGFKVPKVAGDAVLSMVGFTLPPTPFSPTRPFRLVKWSFFLQSVARSFFLLAVLEFAGRITGVHGFSYTYVIADVQANSFGILSVIATWNDDMSKNLHNAIGTDPEKNWKRMMAVMQKEGLKWESLGIAFVLCHYSANPSVWDRIIKNMVDDSHLGAITDATQWVIDFRAFRQHCEWKTGAPTSGKLSPQRFHGSNPTLAAFTYLRAFPNAVLGIKHMQAQRWFVSMAVEAPLKDAAKKMQEKFLQDTFQKHINEKIYKLVSASTFVFPDVTTGSGSFTYANHTGHGSTGVLAHLNQDGIGAWCAKNGGPTQAEFVSR